MLSFRSDSVQTSQIQEYDAGVGTTIEGVKCKDFTLLVSDGSAAAPSFSFASEPTTGIYLTGADTIGIATNGANKLSIGPAALEFANALTTTTFASTQESSGAGSGALVVAGGVAIQGNMYVGGNMNVGGSIIVGSYLLANGSAAAPSYSFTSDTNTGFYLIGASQLGFTVGGTLRMTIAAAAVTMASSIATTTFAATTASSNTSSGALVTLGGIGIASNLTVSGSTFSVAGTQTYTQYAPNAGGGYVHTDSSTSGLFIDTVTNGVSLKSDVNGAGTLSMSLKSDRVAFGVYSSVGSNSVAIGAGATATGTYCVAVGSNANSTGTQSVAIGFGANTYDHSKQISIGRGSPLYSVRPYSVVVGTFSTVTNDTAPYDSTDATFVIGALTSDGGLHDVIKFGYNGAWSFGSSSSWAWSGNSDEALKEEIADIRPEMGLDFVRNIHPITFRWKDPTARGEDFYRGFSFQRIVAAAQTFGSIADPRNDFDATRTPESCEYGAVAPSALIPSIVKALATIEERIKTQRQIIYQE